MYEITIQKFKGPLEKLLELIEERKLEVTEISLAEVTDDFLAYLENIKTAELSREEGMRLIADFILVASRLIFLKSKSLLPDLDLTPEEEADIKDLETRLSFYKAFKPAPRLLASLWAAHNFSVSRPYFLEGSLGQGVFYPGSLQDPAQLKRSLASIFEVFEKLRMETKVISEKIVTLEEKIKEVIEKISGTVSLNFGELSLEKSRAEIIVTFLAILHLARERLVFLEQSSGHSDIIIKKGEPRTY